MAFCRIKVESFIRCTDIPLSGAQGQFVSMRFHSTYLMVGQSLSDKIKVSETSEVVDMIFFNTKLRYVRSKGNFHESYGLACKNHII